MDVKSHRFLEKSKARFHVVAPRIVPGGNGCQGLLSGFFFSGDCLGGFVFINLGQPKRIPFFLSPNAVPCLKARDKEFVMFPIELNHIK